jgi:hypothetical protein
MEDKLKAATLTLWGVVSGWFSFIPSPEARGAVIIMAALVLLFIAPLLFFLLLFGAGAFIALNALRSE